MVSFFHLLQLLLLFSLPHLLRSSPIKPYVVYMGSSSNSDGEDAEAAESAHLELLSSISPRVWNKGNSLLHHYYHAFRGFSAMLTESEASALAGHEKVVSIFPDPVLRLHTTRSWDFLAMGSTERARSPLEHSSNDVIVGVVDSGIWPESPSFNDDGLGEIPPRWKGTCMEGPDFTKSNCNRKLIGARYYDTTSDGNKTMGGSPRDSDGHGTHTASTVAGAPVANASYYGLAKGTARGGGSPSTRIATYKACSPEGCPGAAVLMAIHDAIKDGVDIISISLGGSLESGQVDYLNDPIAIGAFHAEQMGVMVVCAAGNDGPEPYTVVNTAPWILTVAASSIDREFHSAVILGNKKHLLGWIINFSNLTKWKTYPLALAVDAAVNSSVVDEARNCYPGSLDEKKVLGKIVICGDDDPIGSTRPRILAVVAAKAKGMILIGEKRKGHPSDSGVFPFTQVDNITGVKILRYINSTRNPTATILPTIDAQYIKPAPVVAYFSSRGPGELTENILKPDIMAPGVAILAAVVPTDNPRSVPIGEKPSGYRLHSGTSMACPHVSGVAAAVMSVHGGWTSSMVKSALMTTATIYNNMREPLANNSDLIANPHETGVGEINPYRALHPGLVFETMMEDYLNFLCYLGYSEKKIASMAKTEYKCPKNSKEDLISNINYPSISISKLSRHGGKKTIKRTVTNVRTKNSTYIAHVHSPKGLIVEVNPWKIAFSRDVNRVSYEVSFLGEQAVGGYNFGSITWSDGKHRVYTVFTINVE